MRVEIAVTGARREEMGHHVFKWVFYSLTARLYQCKDGGLTKISRSSEHDRHQIPNWNGKRKMIDDIIFMALAANNMTVKVFENSTIALAF